MQPLSALTHRMTIGYAIAWYALVRDFSIERPQWIRDVEAGQITASTWRAGYAWTQLS